jgi:hypothetical protein
MKSGAGGENGCAMVIPGRAMVIPGCAVVIPGCAMVIPGRAMVIPGCAMVIPGRAMVIPGCATVIPGRTRVRQPGFCLWGGGRCAGQNFPSKQKHGQKPVSARCAHWFKLQD